MEEKERQRTAIVIGAGVGGVATAARLAKAGFRVTVVEKNDFTGGRCSLLHHDGYRFDQGPSLLLIPRFFHEIFHDLGTSLSAEGVKLYKCDPNYNIWFGDGENFKLSTDVAAMKTEIEKWEGVDGYERYLGFLQECHRHHEISVKHVLRKNFASFWNMLDWEFLGQLFQLHPFESIYSRASKYFWTERLRRVFTFGSMYLGMSPFDAPGTYSLLQYTELAEGIWYPEGGFHKIVEALVNVGERLGVDYLLSTPITTITTSASGTATGVVLASGKHLTADVVVCNADLVYTYQNLLPPSSYASSLSKRSASCSSLSFYWALSRKVPELSAHNIFLADAYRSSFDSIFKEHLIPHEPSFYVNVPSRIDPTAAPASRDALVVLVPVGHLLPSPDPNSEIHAGTTPGAPPAASTQDWESMIALARRTILATIASRTGVNVEASITYEALNSPLTWKRKFNLDRGAILGLSHSFFNVLCFRPATRHAKIRGLYFVGASTHPGTGVPVVLAGSKITSEQVLRDYEVDVPWEKAAVWKRKEGELDRVRAGPRMSWVHVVALVMLAMMMMMLVGLEWRFGG
ncbi:MAG: ATP-binding cassette transporter CGR1 [Bogoriella megaspora]|nr:MAG: ATP-binding cassette transporter CGR1 [Bogoriella megaspora]